MIETFIINSVSGQSSPSSILELLIFCIAIYSENAFWVVILAAVPRVAIGENLLCCHIDNPVPNSYKPYMVCPPSCH